MQLAVFVSPRLRAACFLALGVWLASFSVNHAHAQGARLQLTASVAGGQLYEVGHGPRPERRHLGLAGPLTLTIAGAVTFAAPYLVAVLTGLWDLGWGSFSSGLDNDACTSCKSSRTLLIPVLGPLLVAGDTYNPFSKGVSIALGVTQAVGLVVLTAGLVWLLTGLPRHEKRRRGLEFGMMAMPLPGGGMVGMRLVLGGDATSDRL